MNFPSEYSNSKPTLPLLKRPNIVQSTTAQSFATIVIEVPKLSYQKHSKTSMRTASRNARDSSYSGPQRLFLNRWKHIKTFYVVNLSEENYYQAMSLTHHPHYSILQSEFDEFDTALTKFQSQHRSCNIKRIASTENFKDDYLLVVNDFNKFPNLKRFINEVNDTNLLVELLANGKLDPNRGNWKMDFGYSSGQNLERDLDQFGVTRPRVLDRTKESCFLDVQKELSLLSDLFSETFELPLYHRLGNIHQKYAAKLHPQGIFPAWRVAVHGPLIYVEVHEDSLNDSRPLMSPVGVLSRIYSTDDGPLRLSKIGYSRQSLFDSDRRESEIKPIVEQFIEWEKKQPNITKIVSNDLLIRNFNNGLNSVIEIQCHLERSVGLSPYIHASIQLQKLLNLSRHQVVAIVYNCVTNESPYFFYSVYELIVLFEDEQHLKLSSMSPVDLGIWFHTRIWDLIEKKKLDFNNTPVPRRHQPHNCTRTKDINISMSITNLIRLTDQFCFLDGDDCKKQFHHSKAVAILMMPPRAGGCYACGGLTSQNLLYTLACIGLIPICVSRWGELAGTETAGFLEHHFHLSYSEGRAEQFLSCCVACSPGFTPEQIENRICKWIRSKKLEIKNSISFPKTGKLLVSPFRDGIWPGQSLYQPIGDHLAVWNGTSRLLDRPPAYDWPNPRGKRLAGDPTYWDQPTRSSRKRVLGGNRRSKKSKSTKFKTLTIQQCLLLLPSDLEIVCQFTRRPLYLSINNLLAEVLGESRPIPNHRIIAEKKKGKEGYHFSVLNESNEIQECVSSNLYRCAAECKADSGIQFAIERNLAVLSKYVWKLVMSHQAAKQLHGREKNGSGAYFLIHDNSRRTKGRRGAIAVVVSISENRLLFVQKNDCYKTLEMSFCYLDK